MELIGEFPKVIAFSGKYSSEFFNRRGEHVPNRFVHSLTALVQVNYGISTSYGFGR